MIQCKPVSDPPTPEDGRRILVDRQCPHDLTQAQLDDWLPDVAPSSELLEAFDSGALDFARFTTAYREELSARPEHWWGLLQYGQMQRLTLVFSAPDPLQNHAVVLAQWLEDELDRYQGSSSPVCYRDEFPGY
ncbi:DUF488 domain-containing protein [Pseudomonas sp. NPDC089569]|uniref:DUF488 domain-containing protein n=1 Tax=Pseudomonas sp. NPDC089569 TaxID=3390722 RepID=UPI003D06E35D